MLSSPLLLSDRQLGSCGVGESRATFSGSEGLLHRMELQRKLEGHAGCVNTVHFSPCGELLISGSDDRTIRFWDHETGAQRLCYASGHHDNVFQARIIPESSNASVVSCAADGEVRVGHISPGGGALQTRKLGSHSGRAHKLALCPQHPATFLSCGEDGAVNFFDLRQPSHSNHRLLVCRAFMGRTLELHSVHCNPASPSQFCVGGGDEFVRVFDLRHPSCTDTGLSAAADPLRRLAPAHLRGSGSGASPVSITCAQFNQRGSILASYNDEDVYLLAGEQYRVRLQRGTKGRPASGKRVRSSDGSQQRARGVRRAAGGGNGGAAAASGLPGNSSCADETRHAGALAGHGAPDSDCLQVAIPGSPRGAEDERPPALASDSGGGGSSGLPSLIDEDKGQPSWGGGRVPGDALGRGRQEMPRELLGASAGAASPAGSSQYEDDWHTDTSQDGGSPSVEQSGSGSMEDDWSSDDNCGEYEYDGERAGGGMRDVDSLPTLCSDDSQSDDGGSPGGWPRDNPVLQRFRGARNSQTVKGCSFMGERDEWVVAGSDCGHVFIWGAADGRVRCMLKGDRSVVNCLDPHPHHPLTLATSGIDDDIKLWAPTGLARPPGAAVHRVMQRNMGQQGAAPTHPILMQHLLNDPLLLTQLVHQLAGATGARPDSEGEEEGDSEDDDPPRSVEDDWDEDEGSGGVGRPQPECAVQ